MAADWTREQILALAPDSSSAKSGQDLAARRKWVSVGRSEGAVWGLCQGSGKDPYQAQVDLSEPAFRCSCPSRKFPCKHALGLFLMAFTRPDDVPTDEPPGWVTDWLSSRAQRAEKKERPRDAAAPDPATQAKRTAQREARVTAGLVDLQLWLRDLLRGGLAAAQSRPYSHWEQPAARMVDAQAPGVARMLREMAPVSASGDGWQDRLLERLGRLQLLLEAWQRLDELPEAVRADVRAALGFNQPQEEVLAGAGVRDRWAVLGLRVEEEDRFRAQRTWLWGIETGRPALLLHFAPFGQPLDRSLLPGTAVDAELVFYPGAYPLRALVRDRGGVSELPPGYPGFDGWEAAGAAHAAALARNPWLDRFPFSLTSVTPVRLKGSWQARDGDGRAVPLRLSEEAGWRLLAVSGGHPVSLFGEWSGETLEPLSARAADTWCSLAPVTG